MKENDELTININLDTDGVENKMSQISTDIKALSIKMMDIKTAIFFAMQTMDADITNETVKVLDTLKNIVAKEIVVAVKEINNTLDGTKTSDTFTNLGDKAFDVMLMMLADALKSTGKAQQPKPLALPLGKVSTSNDQADSPVNSIVGGLVGDMGSLCVYDFSGLLEGLSSVKNKILENVTAWGQELAAKAASKAEDIAIMAMYAADYVKAFGVMVAQLATSAGAWVAETAAKVASTAATWAQVAATTAWSAISTTAAAVTTAFGAAMSFLTSPIGLVVLAITAVIAIVALLIANWDTVKETALSVWEKIKETFATVAQWVDENVLQPITGFFSTAMEWIGTKVQEGIDFVQSIFSGITTFLQGAFSKDWTEQFGAFGNVLNAFFANVQNIWNAIKSIFSGIVSFVKNVFAGDWGAAWDSIVNVFKGIWDYMLAIVKAPINGIIGLINGLVEGVVDGINLVIKALNNISFDIPDWVPLIGGETFGFNLTPLTAPKIPLLAKGAVLPANKPFLAMVGDQRHGTNIEAPLTTIQEAVAMVLSEQLPALMAGFEAVVAEQRATREMIGRIRIGDDVIANAAMRYNRKMAVVRGGW